MSRDVEYGCLRPSDMDCHYANDCIWLDAKAVYTKDRNMPARRV